MTDDLDAARYTRMRWNTPLSEAHADLLLDRLQPAGQQVADIGCGWGELLLRAVERGAKSGIGIDSDPVALDRGRRAAQARGLAGRVEFVATQGKEWRGTAGRALCVGSAHALGGCRAALGALAEVVPTGRLLFGDGFWQETPTAAARELLGEQPSLAELLETVRETGWRVLHLSTADQLEWDDFESTWRAGRQEWLLANPNDPRAGTVRDELDAREREYVTTYRGVLGLAYLVLAR